MQLLLENKSAAKTRWTESARFELDGQPERKYIGLMFPPSAIATAKFIYGLEDEGKWEKWNDATGYLNLEDLQILADEDARERLRMILDWLKGKQQESLVQLMFKVENIHRVQAYCFGKANHFISQNSFHFGGRALENLAAITCGYVDLDYYNQSDEIKRLLDIDENAIASILDICTSTKWIPPTQIVRTGRGLLVRWIYDGFLPAAALSRWQHVQKKIIEMFGIYGADSRAMDASRIFRAIGSLNPKSGQIVREIHAATKINFDVMASLLLDLPRLDQITREAYKQLRIAIDKDPARGHKIIPAVRQAMNTSKRTHRWCVGVCADVLRLANMRGLNMKKHREAAVFVYLNFKLRGGWIPTELEYKEEASRIGELVGGDEIKKEVETSVNSLFKKWKTNRGCGNDKKIYYCYSRMKLIEDFKITDAEQKNMVMLRQKIVTRKHHAPVSQQELAFDLHLRGHTKTEIASLLGMSRSTLSSWFTHKAHTSCIEFADTHRISWD